MTDRERVLAIMHHQPVDGVVWQPRIDHWYYTNKRAGTLPERYRDMSLFDVYVDLDCSIRGYEFYNPCISRVYDSSVSFRVVEDTQHRRVRLWETPLGVLTEVEGKTAESSLLTEFPVKSIADLRIVRYTLEALNFEFSEERFREAEKLVGDRGVGTVFNLRTPLMRLFIEFMGFENTIVALHEFPEEMDSFIRFLEEDDQKYIDMIKKSPLPLLNFGDNVDSNMLPPSLMRKYALPYYRRRTAELRAAGKASYPHWDGALKGLLPFVRECGFDGYEAFTPTPMGDVSLDEIAEAMGHDYVLIDGIPATHFIPPFTRDDVEEFATLVLQMFAPSLILGISDELPPSGDIESVRHVAEIVRSFRISK
ncbi:MAG TPA: uroporphyrinogen decarboxylase family protein [Candidatus Latescibacteria bacterium]|nr:uroporphyrinogen decarboxylase family protein [Candidatus Latescibacterota bacterium]